MDSSLSLHQEPFLEAINNGNFLTWVGLNNPILLKHLPTSIATALVHLDREQKNLHLEKTDTKMISSVKPELNIEEDKYFYPNHGDCEDTQSMSNNRPVQQQNKRIQ